MGTQGASLGAWPAPIVQAQRMPRKHPYVSRRSAHPFIGVSAKQTLGPKNAPRERERLSEMVSCLIRNELHERAANAVRSLAPPEARLRASSTRYGAAERGEGWGEGQFLSRPSPERDCWSSLAPSPRLAGRGTKGERRAFWPSKANDSCDSNVSRGFRAQISLTAKWSAGPCGTARPSVVWPLDLKLPARRIPSTANPPHGQRPA
jgi:hypothetical protein